MGSTSSIWATVCPYLRRHKRISFMSSQTLVGPKEKSSSFPPYSQHSSAASSTWLGPAPGQNFEDGGGISEPFASSFQAVSHGCTNQTQTHFSPHSTLLRHHLRQHRYARHRLGTGHACETEPPMSKRWTRAQFGEAEGGPCSDGARLHAAFK